MTLHELTTTACARLQHEWELGELTTHPERAIRRIAAGMAPTAPQTRLAVEASLHETWAHLCATEGDDR